MECEKMTEYITHSETFAALRTKVLNNRKRKYFLAKFSQPEAVRLHSNKNDSLLLVFYIFILYNT